MPCTKYHFLSAFFSFCLYSLAVTSLTSEHIIIRNITYVKRVLQKNVSIFRDYFGFAVPFALHHDFKKILAGEVRQAENFFFLRAEVYADFLHGFAVVEQIFNNGFHGFEKVLTPGAVVCDRAVYISVLVLLRDDYAGYFTAQDFVQRFSLVFFADMKIFAERRDIIPIRAGNRPTVESVNSVSNGSSKACAVPQSMSE